MKKRTSPLDHVRVAAPCRAGWDNMIGDERVRFCAQCNLNVYNLSEMTRKEAEQLISQKEGRLCVRYYRRTDGTILTRNCPVGLRLLKRRLSRIATVSASAIMSFFAGIFAVAGWRELPLIPAATQGTVVKVIDLPPSNLEMLGEPIMGDLAPMRDTESEEGWVDGRMSSIESTSRPVLKRR